MSKVVKGARFISKITEVPGVGPTIPPNDDHTLGWRDTDIYVGEWFWNVTDAKIYFRDNNGISLIVTPDPATGQIDPSLLPGNYIGAMVYRGVWDASTGQPPGISIGRLTPEKGDYYIVNVSGNTNLDGETDWQVGDYPIYNGLSWDKIDNTEPIIYANNVLYNKVVGATTLTNVNQSLDKIFDEMFITPTFTETVTIDISSFNAGKTALQIDSGLLTDTDKWINWGGTTLGLGSDIDSNSILKIGPKSSTGSALTSTLDLHWLNYPVSEVLRWKMYSSNTDGYIQGYANNGTYVYTKISAVGDSYFNAGKIGIGTTSPQSKLHIETTSSNTGSTTLRVSDTFGRASICIDSQFNFPTDLVFKNNNKFTWDISTRGSSQNHIMSFYTSIDGINLVSNPVMNLTSVFGGGVYGVGINKIPTVALDVSGSTNVSNDITVENNMLVKNDLNVTGDTSLIGNVFVTGDTTYYGAISLLNHITTKTYVDDEIAAHAVGHWASGTTFTPTLKDVVLYNSTATYKVGINKLNPTYDLDVVGNALITSTLDVNSTLNANGNLTISGSITGTVNTTGTVNVGQDLTVDGSINLGTDNTDELILRGTHVTIANVGGTSNINLMFDASGSFGNQVIGIQNTPGGAGRDLTIHSQTTAGVLYNGGDLNLNSGQGYDAGNINITGAAGTNGTGGDVKIKGGNSTSGSGTDHAGDIEIIAGTGTNYVQGGDILISGGTGGNNSSVAGNITIFGGHAINTTGEGGDIIIKQGEGRNFFDKPGHIYIDHIINEPFVTGYSYVLDATSVDDTVRPIRTNFINVNYQSDNDYSTCNVYIYLGQLQLPNHDFMVTIQMYIERLGNYSTDRIYIYKGNSGSVQILRIIPSVGELGYFTAILTWNHVKSVWTIASLSEDNNYTVTEPNGKTI